MGKNQISQVSEVYKAHNSKGGYIFGFTVTYSNGRIRNITRKCKFEDDEIIRKLKLQKQEFVIKKELEK